MTRYVTILVLVALGGCAHAESHDAVPTREAAIAMAIKDCHPTTAIIWRARLDGDVWFVWSRNDFYQMTIERQNGKSDGCVVITR